MLLDHDNGYEREQFFPYIACCKPIRRFVWSGSFCNLFEKIIPGIRYLGVHSFKSNNWNEPYRIDGYNGKELKWNGNALRQTETIDYTRQPEALACFDNFLHDCDSLNIHVVLVLSPIYIEGQRKIRDLVAMKDLYRRMASRYNLPLLDYTKDPMCDDTIISITPHISTVVAPTISAVSLHTIWTNLESLQDKYLPNYRITSQHL